MWDGNRKQLEAQSRIDPTWTRRSLLLSGVLGGSALLAGCLGEDDPDSTPTDGATPDDLSDLDGVHVEGQSLRIPTAQNPDEVHFVYDVDLHLDTVYEQSEDVYQATHEMGVWARWWHAAYRPDFLDPEGPTDFPMLYESYEITPETVSVTIRDDAYWSDGTPVTALDAIGTRARWAREAMGERWGWEAPDTPDGATVWDGIVGYGMPDGPDGKVFEHHFTDKSAWQDAGGFMMDPGWFMFFVAGPNPRAGVRFPTHIEPYRSLVEEALDDWDEQRPIEEEVFDYLARHVTEEDLERLRDPDKFVSHGAWTLKEIVGTQEIVLEPNEHHRHYDAINFDEVILEYLPDDSRIELELVSGHLDYANVTASPESAEAFPDTHEEVTSPSPTGYSIGIDHSSAFGDVRVRQAMMYALHTPNIAQNVHPTATEPISIPGWDSWAAEAVLDEAWATETLLSYEQDLERAEELMIAAGYERGVDDNWEKDGEQLRAEIATQAETPVFEDTVSAQLADFGIQLDVRTLDSATFLERLDGSDSDEFIEDEYAGSGDFDIWAGDWMSDECAGFYAGMQSHWWNGLATRARVRARNYFDHEAQEEGLQGYHESGWVAGNFGAWEEMFIEIPPIGEPDGELEQFNVGYTSGRVNNGPVDAADPQDDNPYYNPADGGSVESYWKQLAWTLNWFLPVLPLVKSQDQHYLNTQNWHWPSEVEGADNDYMWEYFGLNWDTADLAGSAKILADPDNPKPGASVNR